MVALSVACTAAAAAWAYLVIGHGGYWRTGQRLPSFPAPSPAPFPAPAGAAGEPSRWPDVVAVIPARNEAAMLPAVLPTLLGQDYPGALSVILVDDCSTDGTAQVAAGLGPGQGEAPGCPGRSLRVVTGAPLPPGWAGKVWAMAQGLAAAGEGFGYVLFTDADIAWEAGALRALVRAAEQDDRDLVSQMALLRTATGWERVVVPAFVYFFAQLYPFPRVKKLFGVFHCDIVRWHPLTAGIPSRLPVPHSRHNDLPVAALNANGYRALSRSAATGVDMFVGPDRGASLSLFFQGHPEYDADSLAREYRRDVGRFLRGERDSLPALPQGYFDKEATKLIEEFCERARIERVRKTVATVPHEGDRRRIAKFLADVGNRRLSKLGRLFTGAKGKPSRSGLAPAL